MNFLKTFFQTRQQSPDEDKKPKFDPDNEVALLAALYRCNRPTRHILHFCSLRTGHCGRRQDKENRWLHIYIPEEFPLECAFKVSQITNFVALRQISQELREAMPNLREVKVFCGLPHNNPKILAHIK